MATKLKNIKPCGDMVLLRFFEVKQEVFKKNAGGILTFNEKVNDEKKKYFAVVEDVGPNVNLEETVFKIGDRVFYNEYDMKTFGDDFVTYGLLKQQSIWAVYTEDDE